MYKHTHRLFITVTKQFNSSVLLNTANIVNNNLLMTASPVISKISLNAFTCNIITKCFCTKTTFAEFEDEFDENSQKNPSVQVQREIQAEAQKKLDKLLALDVENKTFFNVIELEIDLLRQSGAKVPSTIRPTHWLQILKIKSQNRRRLYLEFLWINEIKKLNDKLKRRENTLSKQALILKKINEESHHLRYGLNNNTMFHRVYRTKMSHFFNSKLISAMMFGEKLVFDCGFESHMTTTEISSCAKQFMFSFGKNRENIDPFDIILCNIDLKGELIKRIYSFLPTMNEPGFPLTYTTKSYLELFPKKDLIYLTPHTNNVMSNFIPDKIYIIGAIVDKAHSKPLTLAKAKEEGIQIAKFPLDNYLDFNSGSNKSLNINHCTDIMLSIKNTNKWEEALKFVPTRKIITNNYDYNRTQNFNDIKNVEPKFRSGHASQLSDAAYNKLKSLRFNQK